MLIVEEIVDGLAQALEAGLSAASLAVPVVRGVMVQRAGTVEAVWSLPRLVLIPGDLQLDKSAAAGRSAEIVEIIDPAPDSDPEDGIVRVVMRRGRFELPLELWVYTQTRFERIAIAAVVEAVLQPFIAGEPADLRIALINSYNSSARVWLDAFEPRDQETQEEDFAAARWRLAAAASLLSHTDRPKIAAIVEEEEV